MADPSGQDLPGGAEAAAPIRVLLADDQPLIRLGFRMFLRAEPGIEVVGEADDGASAVRLARQLRPDVVFMDVRMPGMDGIEATAAIVAARLPTRVLILTTFDLDQYVYAGLRAGASGFLLKDARPAELAAAAHAVAAGEAVIAPSATRRLLETFTPLLPTPEQADARAATLAALTDREHDVLLLVAQARTNREIADELHVSEATVKVHVGRILAKLGLRDRVQTVAFAYETGLITPGAGHRSRGAQR
ncbi:response regulator transcription factor [Frankia sp. AgB1.9]|uniref:response regulator n=1 Tax=unclassified Frankia TaxID=2632575 RepID=UPI0019345CC3|nr:MULTISPECIES: response regulator transcription factor [unclassified Frankia]MBL7489847.1 response regulator transcription factor [Frankia sp. AgW1.1]MBL7552693.1 response regulator transcription factor [Frankia sp. AgB1.9]MBL7623858.1 response regulator transcription factor [Frankia sp. AgB1.8]